MPDQEVLKFIYNPHAFREKSFAATVQRRNISFSSHFCEIQHLKAESVHQTDYLFLCAFSKQSSSGYCLIIQTLSVNCVGLICETREYCCAGFSFVRDMWKINVKLRLYEGYNFKDAVSVIADRVLCCSDRTTVSPCLRSTFLAALDSGQLGAEKMKFPFD